MIVRIRSTQQNLPQNTQRSQRAGGATFGEVLKQQAQQTQPLAFSKHARERAEERGIEVDDTLMN